MFYYQNRPILKTLGQFENLGFVIMSTRENIGLIARCPLINIFLFLGMLNLDIFPSKKLRVFCLCNL